MTTHHPSSEMDLSFQHLQLEFARLDILLHRQIQRQQLGAQPEEGESSPLSSYHITDTQAYSLLQRPLGYGSHPLPEEMAQPYAEAQVEAEQHIARLVSHVEHALAADPNSERLRLFDLATLLDLDRFEVDALLACVAPLLDPRYGRLYSYLQDDLTRKRPSIHLILDLLVPPGAERLRFLSYFSADAPLFRHRLLERLPEPGGERPLLTSESIAPDDSIVTWLLLGQYQPNSLLKQHLAFHACPVDVDASACSPELRQIIRSVTTGAASPPGDVGDATALVFYDKDHVSQQTAAKLLAAEVRRPLLTLDLASATQAGILPLDAISLLLRDALLTNAIPHITGWDSCLEEDAPPAGLLSAVCQHPSLLVISGQKRWQPRQVARSRRLRWIPFPIPDSVHRERLLRHYLRDQVDEDSEDSDDLNVAGLAGQFMLTTGQLRDLVDTARDMAAQDGGSLREQHLFAAARTHSNPRLESQARKIEPRYTWDDLVLPAEQITILNELVDTVRSRPLVLEQWGVGEKLTSSAGVTALFFGPPGTGKTMAAEVIAGELSIDLYKIDLSGVVSKYIGETEKNLERIFTEAESSNAILFFDEADAIFGKRSEVKDAHDRYANIEVSYLLQRMEAYNGVTILSTNMRANLDEAFMRRLQFALDFPFPRAQDRLRIWQALFPPGVPRDPDLDLKLLADRFEIAGGNIRNIIVSAAYLAASNGQMVSMKHLMHGTRRELQKMGRLVNDMDMST